MSQCPKKRLLEVNQELKRLSKIIKNANHEKKKRILELKEDLEAEKMDLEEEITPPLIKYLSDF
jgi:hypothetical protein